MTDEERIKLKEKMRAKARAEAEKEMLENDISEEEILYQQMLEEERQKLQNGGTAVCPFCASIISAKAIVCPVCRMSLTNTPQVVVKNEKDSGEEYATASLVLGLIGLVLVYFDGSLFSIILGIIGVCLAGVAKSKGYIGGKRTAGFVLSLLSIIVGVVFAILTVFAVHVGLSMLNQLWEDLRHGTN